MYTSLRAVRPIASPAFRRQLYLQPSFRRVISTSASRFAKDTSDTGKSSHNQHYVEGQNHTSSAREEVIDSAVDQTDASFAAFATLSSR